ncbi:AraC-like transcriptional regulator QhpR [Pararhodospirillum photometricum]|uniref:Transcriptional regulator, AraC family n=1 Tax=Pararhodospirillum photometricum DSM 122 TaxID=1150469 RepID=H6SNM2_PARPM|nr:AraC family transcriptional regulator [Pararhodospirillum photometricum]CCG09353.1 Transcriptional regulator, AraC family [Pararhodospirillum photometricum DSM 122]
MGSFCANIRQSDRAVCPATRQRNILAAAAFGVSGFISQLGGDAPAVFGLAGVPENALGQPDVALDLGAYCAMMELAAAETRHDNFGLWFGQQFQPHALGLIGDIALVSPTLGAAVENLASLFPFHQQATETRLTAHGDLLSLEYRILDGHILRRRQDAELTMGMFANVFRACLGAGWVPEEVHFEHPRPLMGEEHQKAFAAPVHFAQRTNAVVFHARDLGRRMPGGDLARLTELRARLIALTGGTGVTPFLDRVRAEIRSRLPEGAPHVEAVAAGLGVARWTLQRRLADEGFSFSALVDQVRRDLALHYVRQPHIPFSDLAFFLGYSELSAFTRAFGRWFGVSPTRLRQASQGGEAGGSLGRPASPDPSFPV